MKISKSKISKDRKKGMKKSVPDQTQIYIRLLYEQEITSNRKIISTPNQDQNYCSEH